MVRLGYNIRDEKAEKEGKTSGTGLELGCIVCQRQKFLNANFEVHMFDFGLKLLQSEQSLGSGAKPA
jgi:hypothetical protein